MGFIGGVLSFAICRNGDQEREREREEEIPKR